MFRYKQIPFIKKDLMPGNLDGSWDTYGLSDVKPKVIPVIQFEDRSVADGHLRSYRSIFDLGNLVCNVIIITDV